MWQWKEIFSSVLSEKQQRCRAESYPFSVAVGSLRTMGGPPQGSPVVVKVACRIHLMLSKQMETSNTLSTSSYYRPCTSHSVSLWVVFTSRMKNLAVLALPQVFFSRDTGLMFIPATAGNGLLLLIQCQVLELIRTADVLMRKTNTHRWWPWGSWSFQCWNTPWLHQWKTRSPELSAFSSQAAEIRREGITHHMNSI